MATVKRFTLAATTGSSPVLVLRRGSDGHIRDNDDGAFKPYGTCITPYLALSEDADLTGFFTVSITGEVFEDDTYTALFYASSAMTGEPLQTKTVKIHGDYAVDPGSGVALVEYALCTLQQVKAELVITGTDEDDRISRAINDATDRIETVTNRKLMKRAAAVEEYADGEMTDDSGSYQVIWPKEYPIESIGDVVSIQAGMSGTPTTLDLASVEIDRRRVLVCSDGGLVDGYRENLLTYRPGYSVAPHDIQGVAINLAQRLYWVSRRVMAGDESESAGGSTRKAAALAFSADDQLVIDEYTRVHAGDWKRGQSKRTREWVR